MDGLNVVVLDAPGAVFAADVVRVVLAAVAAFSVVLYLRLGWCRLRRGYREWPVCGTLSLVLLLVVVADTAMSRRGEPVTVRGLLVWAAVPLAAAQALRNWRLRLHPSWVRPRRAGSHRR